MSKNAVRNSNECREGQGAAVVPVIQRVAVEGDGLGIRGGRREGAVDGVERGA